MKQEKRDQIYFHPEVLVIPMEGPDCICTSTGVVDPSMGNSEYGAGIMI